jgi:mannose-1-phosphate guanylyltransferase/mannose-6-phosphate isomerase
MAAACRQAVAGMSRDLRFVRLEAGAWHDCPTDSIDYAVMEKTTDAVVLPLESDWSDIGSWEGVWEAGEADADGNVVNGDIRTHDVAGTLIWGGERLVVAEGVRDLVIVDSDDAVLVCRRGGSQDVRDIVTALRADSRPEAEQHRTVHRPWGSYRSIDRGTNFQVKRLVLEPGASISLQRHSRRAEHWVVVCGLARVTRGDEVLLLTPNQSTYIPVGTVHRLENAGDGVLEVIEVQTGDYLGEDDIERFDDEYGRLDKARQAAAK